MDDEANLPIFLKDFLEECGFDVSMAVTGKSALRVALENPPDAIILDVDLPDTDGYTLCRTMRRTSTLRTVPIVMLTALSDKRNEIAGLRAGADDYLTKPIDTERLQARLENALSRNIRELDANPLTHLPGNTSILQEMERRLRKQEAFAVIYSDLNNFKAFNDRYGFLRGDQAIKLAAQCIVFSVEGRAAQSMLMSGNWFIGHVGGDDFVVILPAEKAEDVSREIIKRFDAAVPDLYDPEDRARGFIQGKTRQGEPAQFPFVGIALAIVSNGGLRFSHPGEISSMASELKSYAKSFGKSAFVTDRRDRMALKEETDSAQSSAPSLHEKPGENAEMPPDIFSELGFLPEPPRPKEGG
ncbi:MAG: response regulator [Elusimicrobia bacterium]|nr:response regulator [Elusimicrobiota bacterium]